MRYGPLDVLIEPGERIVRVKSWWPRWHRGCLYPHWPTVLIERRDGRRETRQPMWTWRRVKLLLGQVRL